MTAQPYFEEIEAHFAARRGTPFILSAKDWALMKSWHDEGVPLPVLLDAVIAAEDVATIRAEIAASLAGAKLDEKTRARTEEANLRRLVRERFGLPRLTLF